jgi:hypothetical protein
MPFGVWSDKPKRLRSGDRKRRWSAGWISTAKQQTLGCEPLFELIVPAGPQGFQARVDVYISEDVRMTKIYVGNLPFTATEPDVRELFAQHGTVESVALPTDRETGRPRGFGFVEMPQADAQRAMQALNGFNMGGRPLRVNEAQDRPRTGGGGGRPGGGGGGYGGGGGGRSGGGGGYGGGGGGGGGGGQRRW